MVLQGTIGTIIRLTRYTAKGFPGETLESAQLVINLGMEGDFYAKGGERQLSLLFLEDRQWMEDQNEPGLCFNKFKENVLLDGTAVLAPGIRLAAGYALLEISDTGKHCFAECPRFSRGQDCVLAGRKFFAKVIRSGPIKTGDIIIQVCK